MKRYKCSVLIEGKNGGWIFAGFVNCDNPEDAKTKILETFYHYKNNQWDIIEVEPNAKL